MREPNEELANLLNSDFRFESNHNVGCCLNIALILALGTGHKLARGWARLIQNFKELYFVTLPCLNNKKSCPPPLLVMVKMLPLLSSINDLLNPTAK